MEMSIGLRPSCGLTVAESPRLTIRYCSPRDNRPFWLLFNETSASFSAFLFLSDFTVLAKSPAKVMILIEKRNKKAENFLSRLSFFIFL